MLQDARLGAGELGKFLGTVPSLLTRAARLAEQIEHATREGFVLATDSVSELGKTQAAHNIGSTIALWVIVILLALLVFWK